MRPLILSGGPAAGKTTCGRILAASCSQAAYIDADDVRQLVVSGGRTLWSGKEGEAQHELSAHNVVVLAQNFMGAGFDVVIADFLTRESLAVYRAALPEAFVIQLKLPLNEARRRSRTRTEYLTSGEFDLLHQRAAKNIAADLVLDVTGMSIKDQSAAIQEVWKRNSIRDPDNDAWSMRT